ncbi:MAG: hypothetical protein AMXMBFR84_05560 [Candidatus Hydrogenedentota bacterium]
MAVTPQTVVLCSVCGHQVAVSPGVQRTSELCPKCGCIFQSDFFASLDPLPIRPIGAPASGSRSAISVPNPRLVLKLTLLEAVKWAVPAGLLLGIVFGIALGVFLREQSTAGFQLGWTMGLSLGIPLGLTLGAIWGVIHARDPGLTQSTVTGAVIGMAVSVVHHPLESILVAQSDFSLVQNSVIGLAVGAFAGLVMNVLRPDE